MNNWLRYAQWELEQKEFRRARSILERALDVDPSSVSLWIRYANAEMKERNINHARNVLNRAVTQMPRIDKLWYRFVWFEELLGNFSGTRNLFQRWLSWAPDQAVFYAAIEFEVRYEEVDRARQIFLQLLVVHPQPRNWIKFAQFEQESGSLESCRQVFSDAIDSYLQNPEETLFIEFAPLETKLRESDRARAIYRFGLDQLPRSNSQRLYGAYSTFEKRYGDQGEVENTILVKRRAYYETEVRANPRNYDTWINYIRLLETLGDITVVREAYERAISHLPPTQEKRHWRRYIYLWLFYAIFEELDCKDMDRASQIYQECLRVVPHKHFTFAKLWTAKAKLHLRRRETQAARKTMGKAIGMFPKDRLFKTYLDLETKLFEFDRTIHAKRIEWNPRNPQAWIGFAELERGLGDNERARAIFELALEPRHDQLLMPEMLWKAYIDFEDEELEYERPRSLYERLLTMTNHAKVWISFVKFEINASEAVGDAAEIETEGQSGSLSEKTVSRARNLFRRGLESMKMNGQVEDRITLLDAWEDFEKTHGTPEDVLEITNKKPRKARRRRKFGEDSEHVEEYVEHIFPEDAGANKLPALLEKAYAWKREQTEGGTEHEI